MTLRGTGCVIAHTMHVECGFIETRSQKAAVQFLSELARSASCLWTILVVLHYLSPLILLSVDGPVYNIFVAVFMLPPRCVSQVKVGSWQAVC